MEHHHYGEVVYTPTDSFSKMTIETLLGRYNNYGQCLQVVAYVCLSRESLKYYYCVRSGRRRQRILQDCDDDVAQAGY
jgi:hypothetical protein